MTDDGFMTYLNDGRKTPISKESIFSEKIRVRHLKLVDKVFKKGLHYYLDPSLPINSPESSIFFRKDSFNTDLNIGARKIVNDFEELKISLSAISKLADFKTERKLPVYSLLDNPREIAEEVNERIYPEFKNEQKHFLKALIEKLAECNILVFEFIETWNKKEKANINGFFLNPNVIVLKRQQSSFRREIFTLVHELAHYLLNQEEVEEVNVTNLKSSKIERWCNDFAFYFLVQKSIDCINKLGEATEENNYQYEIINQISKETHLSKMAIFTHLLYNKKISPDSYNNIKHSIEQQYEEDRENKKIQKEIDKLNGVKRRGAISKPINSPLLVSTIQVAFYEGLISEYDVCKSLHISPDKFLQEHTHKRPPRRHQAVSFHHRPYL